MCFSHVSPLSADAERAIRDRFGVTETARLESIKHPDRRLEYLKTRSNAVLVTGCNIDNTHLINPVAQLLEQFLRVFALLRRGGKSQRTEKQQAGEAQRHQGWIEAMDPYHRKTRLKAARNDGAPPSLRGAPRRSNLPNRHTTQRLATAPNPVSQADAWRLPRPSASQ